MEILIPNKYKGSRAIEAVTITTCFYGVKFNFPGISECDKNAIRN